MLVHTHVLVLFDDQVGDGNDDGDEGYEIRKKKEKKNTATRTPKSKRPNYNESEGESGGRILGGRARKSKS